MKNTYSDRDYKLHTLASSLLAMQGPFKFYLHFTSPVKLINLLKIHFKYAQLGLMFVYNLQLQFMEKKAAQEK